VTCISSAGLTSEKWFMHIVIYLTAFSRSASLLCQHEEKAHACDANSRRYLGQMLYKKGLHGLGGSPLPHISEMVDV
jgi:hypothetical protein